MALALKVERDEQKFAKQDSFPVKISTNVYKYANIHILVISAIHRTKMCNIRRSLLLHMRN